jgi:hypothetical protein
LTTGALPDFHPFSKTPVLRTKPIYREFYQFANQRTEISLPRRHFFFIVGA